MHSMADQLAALQRIAVFSARLRGHEMGEWRTDNSCAVGSCVRCGRQLRLACSPFEPDIDGPALESICNQGAVEKAA